MNKILPLLCCLMLFASTSLAQQHFGPKLKNQQTQVAPSIMPVQIDGSQRSAKPLAPRYQSLRIQGVGQNAQTIVWEVQYEAESGLPLMMKRARPETENRTEQAQPAMALQQFAQSATTVLPLDQAQQELEILRTETDDLGHTHIRVQQTHMGVPIYGAEGILHYSAEHEMFNGRLRQSPAFYDVEPNLSPDAAAQVAMQDITNHANVRSLNSEEQTLLDYYGPKTKLWIYPSPQYGYRLCYTVELRPNFLQHWMYFVDANNGQILNHYDHTCSIGPTTATGQDLNGQNQTINVFEAPNGVYYLLDASKDMYTGPSNNLPSNDQGFILTADFNNTSPSNPN
ncbi:MAG: hypothetical protein AAFQ68_29170, partial [Bacteroidota bacterium]